MWQTHSLHQPTLTLAYETTLQRTTTISNNLEMHVYSKQSNMQYTAKYWLHPTKVCIVLEKPAVTLNDHLSEEASMPAFKNLHTTVLYENIQFLQYVSEHLHVCALCEVSVMHVS